MRAYLKGSQQLAAAFDTGYVKKEVDGPGCDFWPVFSVSLNCIQDLLFVLVSTHLGGTKSIIYEGVKPT